MSVSIEIPTKPLVHKYMMLNYGTPAVLREDTVSKLLIQMLEKPFVRNDNRKLPERLSMKTQVIIKHDIFIRRGYILTNQDIATFNSCVTDQVYTLMFMYLDGIKENTPEKRYWVKDAILKFGEKIGFTEEELSIDAAYKKYIRDFNNRNSCFTAHPKKNGTSVLSRKSGLL